MPKKMMVTFFTAILTTAMNPVARTETPSLTIYKLNPTVVRDSDPIWNLIREDSAAGTIGRMAVTLGSGVEWFRKGYHRQIGLLDLNVGEAEMPGSRDPGVRSSIGCHLMGDRLRLSLSNDAPLDGSPQQIQRANLTFQIKTR